MLMMPKRAVAQTNVADPRNLQVVASNAVTANRNQRIALVIGNANYREAPLLNSVNDARAIGKALQDSGFTVILRENTDQRGMMSALREFGDKLRSGGVGIFYYAGHGMQIKGRNYLIPVGANVEREDEVAYSAVDAQAVLDKMEAAGNASNIMILDACRNNPFTRSTRSGQAGLAQMDAPVGTLVAFATSPGAVASDGAGANGLYTQHLLDAMRKPGLKVEDVFKQVRANVRRDSQGKQVPWESTSLEGDFYFKPGAVGGEQSTAARPVATEAQIEVALWDAVKNSTLPIELRAYLNRYPQGRFAEEARGKIARLQAPVVIASAPSTAVTSTPASPATPTPSSDLQAAIDKRTDELLQQLASTIPATVSTASTPATAPRPIAISNSFGFTVGDRWRYQVVDKFKGEVINNYNLQIDSATNNQVVINGGSMRWDERGNMRYQRFVSGNERYYESNPLFVPLRLVQGHKDEISYSYTFKPKDGSSQVVQIRGSSQVVKREFIRTPAGDFNAWRIEREEYRQNQSNSDDRGRSLMTGWYVPELRNFVVYETESRNSSGALSNKERRELTSYSVRGADEALAKR